MRNFRKIEVWTDSINLTISIYDVVKELPDSEKYGLKSQMERCSVSIPSNIAEGASRRTSANFAHFLDIAIGSAFELETQLIICRRIGFIASDKAKGILTKLRTIQKRLNSLRTAILRT